MPQHRTFHQKPAWAPPVRPTAARCTSWANKSAESSSLPGAENPAGSATGTERAVAGQRFGAESPRVRDSKAPRVRSTGAPARGWVAVPRAPRDPSRLPQFASPRPPRPLTPASPSAGRARGHRAHTDRLTEATHTPRGATAASSECVRWGPQARQHPPPHAAPTWRRHPPPLTLLPGKGRWPRAPKRPHSPHGTNYRARRGRLAAPASPFRLGARARRPRPRARGPARGAPWEREFSSYFLGEPGGRCSPAAGGLLSKLRWLPHPRVTQAGPFPVPAASFQPLRRSIHVRSSLIILFFTLTVCPSCSLQIQSPAASPASTRLVGEPQSALLELLK